MRAAPLSEVKKTKEFSAMLRVRSRLRIFPTLSSISRTASPYLWMVTACQQDTQGHHRAPGTGWRWLRGTHGGGAHSDHTGPSATQPAGTSGRTTLSAHRPRWLLPRKGREAYTGACVASTAQYRKNGCWAACCCLMKSRASWGVRPSLFAPCSTWPATHLSAVLPSAWPAPHL